MKFVFELQLVLSALIGAGLALGGNYYLQRRIIPRIREAEDLKRRLYELLEIAAQYWALDQKVGEARRLELESRIVATILIVAGECVEMRRHSYKLTKWYRESTTSRQDLIDAITGGCFQEKEWKPDPTRIIRAAKAVHSIVRTMNRAH